MFMFHYFGLFLGWVSVFHRYPVLSFLLSDMFSQKLWQKKVGGLITIVLGCVELKCSYISREVHARSRRMVSERFMVMT